MPSNIQIEHGLGMGSMTHDLGMKFTSKFGDLSSDSHFQALFSNWDHSLRASAKAVADFLRENTAKILVQSAKDVWELDSRRSWKILVPHTTVTLTIRRIAVPETTSWQWCFSSEGRV